MCGLKKLTGRTHWIKQEMHNILVNEPLAQQQPTVAYEISDEDLIWQALAMTMSKLLNLVLWFRELMMAMVQNEDRPIVSTNSAESTDGPVVMDHQNPAIRIIIKGQDVPGCIINDGSGWMSLARPHVIALASETRRFVHFGFGWPTYALSNL